MTDWERVRRGLRSTDWSLLGTDMPYGIADAVRRGKITAMRGVLVSTRNNRFDTKGKRWCDIYLRLP